MFENIDLVEVQMEAKFKQISLFFRIDEQTVQKRLQIHLRNQAEAKKNVTEEMCTTMQCLQNLTQHNLLMNDMSKHNPMIGNTKDKESILLLYNLLQKGYESLDVVEACLNRLIMASEYVGAVEQEGRLYGAIYAMIAFVNELQTSRQRNQRELEIAKSKLNINFSSTSFGSNVSTLSADAMSSNNDGSVMKRRKSSVVLSGDRSVCSSLKNTTCGSLANLLRSSMLIQPNQSVDTSSYRCGMSNFRTVLDHIHKKEKEKLLGKECNVDQEEVAYQQGFEKSLNFESSDKFLQLRESQIKLEIRLDNLQQCFQEYMQENLCPLEASPKNSFLRDLLVWLKENVPCRIKNYARFRYLFIFALGSMLFGVWILLETVLKPIYRRMNGKYHHFLSLLTKL